VHEGLMVDVQAVNAKLVGRSQNILRRLSGRSEQELRDALQRAGGNVKKAMLILQGCTPDKAAALLQETGGRLRTALRLLGASSEPPSEIPTVEAEAASAVPDKAQQK
jgi:N-acetylmuramic acid 6-phosphate etherase